ncbi:MAG: ATP-dependent RNA helicase HrpA [Neisseriaceae bacterium]|nr:ATP-dependent RNA helicase HrpA [Neisseriaceae bacterium]
MKKQQPFDLSQVLCKDRFFLQKGFRQPEKFGGLSKIQTKYHQSHNQYLQRKNALPTPQFNQDLPVFQSLDAIKNAIENNQVVIVCGETGSGKTTQLPQSWLALGRGVVGLIGHPQPRRLAAMSVAHRIAAELGEKMGDKIASKMRFTDNTTPHTLIKLMTDGILLAETQSDRFLTAYDTIIIDEAHERSLNIDFLLGYLKNLLPRRPDLKVIITSATIDAHRFSQHFENATIIEVSGRTYPVEIRYRPFQLDDDEMEVEMPEAISNAVSELTRIGQGDILVFLPGEREIRETADFLRKSHKDCEILPLFARLSNTEQAKIFRPNGENRRIVLATNVAETSLTVPNIHFVIDTGLARIKRYSPRTKVEQLQIEKISQAAAKQRAGRCGRIAAGVCIRLYSEDDFRGRDEYTLPEILRSNLASVLLRMAALKLGDIDAFPFIEKPDNRYINDGYQLLQELGAMDDKRQMTAIGKNMAKLPIDPKIARMLLAAIKHHSLAEVLVIVAALSIPDPRERPADCKDLADKARERFYDKNSDFLVYLNIWDSFQKQRDSADSNRQLLAWCRQYFLSYLRMREWRDLHKQLVQTVVELNLAREEDCFREPKTIVQNKVQQIDIHNKNADLSAQFKQKALDKKQRRQINKGRKQATYEAIHRSLLTGLTANIGLKSPDGNDYLSSRGTHFYIFPASALFKGNAKWLIAAELTETSKIYARDNAKIEPEWVEQEMPHLVRYHYFEPHWERKRGEVIAQERVTLFGLTLLPRRPVSYGKIDPIHAREIFIREALACQECDIQAAFFRHNRRVLQEIEEIEHKTRKTDISTDEESLFAFYDEKIPYEYIPAVGWATQPTIAPQGANQNTQIKDNLSGSLKNQTTPNGVAGGLETHPTAVAVGKDAHPTNQSTTQKNIPIVDIQSFEIWRNQAEQENPKLLFLDKETLLKNAEKQHIDTQFPEYLTSPDGKFKLSYRFEPNHPMDGATIDIPLSVLNRINANRLEWLVAGMIREKLTLLIKALPKQIRRLCVPVPQFITEFLSQDIDYSEKIIPQLARFIAKTAGDMRLLDEINIDEWQNFRLPEYAYFNIKVIDDGQQELAIGRDINQLKQQLGNAATAAFRDSSNEFEQDNLTSWNIGRLPENIKFARGKRQLVGYPALKLDKDGKIGLRLFDTPELAEHEHRQGVIALMKLQMKEQIKDLNKGLNDFTKIALIFRFMPSDTLKDEITQAVCDRAFIGEDDLPKDEKAFKEQIKKARSRIGAVKVAINEHLLATAGAYAELQSKISNGKHPLCGVLKAQCQTLLGADFITQTPYEQWVRMPIYIKAMSARMDKYGNNPARDAAREADIQALEQQWQEKINQLHKNHQIISGSLKAFFWKIQELRVSLFAQELKTPYPVSLKRLNKEFDEMNKIG